ncbi:MAG: glycosyl hydrolase family protein [Gammaproteobacteria bacterium]|nr:MAG: glycosyl hydrolase family protein [Gammaproteobacteria bacterium]
MRSISIILLTLCAGLAANVATAKSYKGAEVYSNQSYLYGRYEMRMRVAKASGVLSTFFTYKNGSEVGDTFWEEIDIEIFGKNDATQWQSNVILGSSRPTIHTEQVHTAPQSLADAYHTYVLEWTPDYVAWFVDGEEARRITGTSTVTSLTNAQSLRFNIWSSESVEWVGAWDDSVLPVYQFISYVEYKSYNATAKNFEGGWRDDFDTLDTSRWSKANWSFDMNRVDFAPENVLVKNGILVLALTKEDAMGYAGTPPADESVSSSSASSVAVSSSVASSSVASSAAASSTPASSKAASSTASKGNNSGGGGSFSLWGLLALSGLLLARRRK